MIQWFPGHMHKAMNALKKLMPDIDIIIELLDARAPLSSCNPLLQHLTRYKKNIKILNKADLADDTVTNNWLSFFKQIPNTIAFKGYKTSKTQKNHILQLCRKLCPHKISFAKPLRVMIIGIPNVGKSTLINQLTNRKSALTGDIPAVTKANQCLTISNDFLIYDTPGMMWHNIEKLQIGYNLAICNSIGRNACDVELLAIYLLEYIKAYYPSMLIKRYNLTENDLLSNSEIILSLIAKKRGCCVRGNTNVLKVSELIVQDFRNSKLGLISLETPELWQEWQNITNIPTTAKG